MPGSGSFCHQAKNSKKNFDSNRVADPHGADPDPALFLIPDPDPVLDPRFLRPKIEKKILSREKNQYFLIKNCNLLNPRPL